MPKFRFHKITFLRSLKVRIFLILLMVGLIPCFVMRYAILQNYERRAISVRSSNIATQVRILANHLIARHYLEDTSSEVINAELEQLSNLYDGRVLIINTQLRIVKDTYGISEGKTIISEEVIRCLRGESTEGYDKENGYIEMTIPIMETVEADLPVGAGDTFELVRGVMLVSASNDSVIATMDSLNRQAMVVESIVGVLIFVVTLLVSKFLFQPFKKMIEALDQVQEGYTNDPISVTDCLETEHIGDAFNRVLGRMKMLDDSRQDFVSNVSHELRTPITSMKVLADSLITQKDVPLEVYQEFMTDIAAEIEEVDTNALVELIMKRLRPIAMRRDVQLVYESLRPVTASVDEVKLTLALSNLVENAIKYNKEHGFVKVTLDADHQYFTVQVEDSGVGIPEEELEHIFERFYRVDKSRSREIGGTGLGLAITKSAVRMHRGSIKVSSLEGEGTDFTVKIPLKYIATQPGERRAKRKA